MVIEIKLSLGATKYIVIEMKVDSIPYEEQLNGTFSDFTESVTANEQDICFMLFLFGFHRYVKSHQITFSLYAEWTILSSFLARLISLKKNYLDWLESLNEELSRLNNLMNILPTTNNIWDYEFWKDYGYRPPLEMLI